MNRNSLERNKEEMQELRFSEKLTTEMEQKMQKNLPQFQVREQVQGNKGLVDYTLHFKQSGQTEKYFMNQYDVTLIKSKPLEEGEKYLVISPGEEPGKNLVRKFDSPYLAIDYFKEQKGKSELARGKNPANKTTLAEMEKGKVNYINKEFERTYYAPVVTQTFYVEEGKGFNADQAAALIQGRYVYRDDLVNLGGQPYKAWIGFNFDKPKDPNGNYITRQFLDPNYGFDIGKAIDKIESKDLANQEKREAVIEEIKNGNRPLIPLVKEGENINLHIEANPRYGQTNFYHPNGKPEHREQFLKPEFREQAMQLGKGKEKELEAEQGLTR
ncbi:hypothetical protein [Mucilaginibacter sp.]